MSSKIIKSGGSDPDPFETQVAQALLELEMNSDLKAQLRELHITKAKEIDLNNKKVCFSHLTKSHFFLS
jgi:small subunit ribosomal protein S7e